MDISVCDETDPTIPNNKYLRELIPQKLSIFRPHNSLVSPVPFHFLNRTQKILRPLKLRQGFYSFVKDGHTRQWQTIYSRVEL